MIKIFMNRHKQNYRVTITTIIIINIIITTIVITNNIINIITIITVSINIWVVYIRPSSYHLITRNNIIHHNILLLYINNIYINIDI